LATKLALCRSSRVASAAARAAMSDHRAIGRPLVAHFAMALGRWGTCIGKIGQFCCTPPKKCQCHKNRIHPAAAMGHQDRYPIDKAVGIAHRGIHQRLFKPWPKEKRIAVSGLSAQFKTDIGRFGKSDGTARDQDKKAPRRLSFMGVFFLSKRGGRKT
jgi:hypothetical protein